MTSEATRRYKQVLAELTDAAAALRELDRRRAAEIRLQLIPLEDEMLRSGERARLTEALVQLHWEAALDLLWAESWMQLRPRPEPNPRADPEQLEAYDAEVHSRAELLRAAVRRRWYDFGR